MARGDWANEGGVMAQPKHRCAQCGQELLPGIRHVCPVQQKDSGGLDWKWWVAFLLQFLVLMGTILYKGGMLQSTVENIQKEQDKQGQRLDKIESYFLKPVSGGP